MFRSAIAAYSLVKAPRALQWLLLLLVSALFILLGFASELPAAALLGAMFGAIFIAAGQATVRVHRSLALVTQAVVGVFIARAITVEFFLSMGRHLPVIAVSIAFVLLASMVMGYILALMKVFPGTSAIWGAAPGAATAMTLLAEDHGADARLVAFMQYVRVVMVTTVATLVFRLTHGADTMTAPDVIWFPAINWPSFGPTLLLILGGTILGVISRIPSGVLVIPLILGALLQDFGLVTIDLPPWLLVASFVLIGWRIGLGFSRPILLHTARRFPAVFFSTLILIAVCGLFGLALGHLLGIDPLTAYLATSPGGADTVAIIAASSDVDLPFIVAMQTSRFFVILLIGPAVARAVVRLLARRSQ
ncbi:AbrB family transcriptional regulator [Daeguia caeni]|uniref:AbrB family transcriptional regulator n=1 Tax=Daeguia caeni TaxID=439612 RepID=A0ABV9H7X5_9HYPH